MGGYKGGNLVSVACTCDMPHVDVLLPFINMHFNLTCSVTG